MTVLWNNLSIKVSKEIENSTRISGQRFGE